MGGIGDIRSPMELNYTPYSSPFAPPLPELNELPAIRQIPYTSITPTPEAEIARQTNAAKRVSYGQDRARLKRNKAQSRYEERMISRALANRDEAAGKRAKSIGNAKQRFAGQRMRNFALATGVGPDLFRVLR